MPTKRRRIGPRRIGAAVPEWARRLVELGEEPASGSEAEIAYVSWLFFSEQVAGLPPFDSEEGRRIFARRKWSAA